MKNYILVPDPQMTYDGSIKPRTDIGAILSTALSFQRINYPMYSVPNNYKLINDNVVKTMMSHSNAYLQFPLYTNFPLEVDFIEKAHAKEIKVIAIVHDINSLRGLRNDIQKDISILNQFDLITLPSRAAKSVLERHNLITPVVVQENPFDFLTTAPLKTAHFSKIVNFAGNISYSKAVFLKNMRDVTMHVYGSNLDFELPNNIKYLGKLSNDELVEHLGNGFGLLWDAGEINKPTFKSYEKYNWQYKLSLYLAAGIIPVADKMSNVGKWLKFNGCGITISDFEDLHGELLTISRSKYETLQNEVKLQQHRVREGYYTQKLVSSIEKSLEISV